MPVITIVGGEVAEEKKSKLIEEMTEVASTVMGTPKQFFTVIIDEKPDSNIGLGGEPLTAFKARLQQSAEKEEK